MKSRPAETAGIAGSFAILIAHLIGVTDPATITAIGMIVGFIPAAVTWTVELVRGKNKETIDTGNTPVK